MKHLESISLPAAGSCVPALLRFAYLQCLDLLTTIAFLVNGAQEGNPLVRAAMALTTNPLLGLVYAKSLALVLGVYCWRRGKRRLLDRVNVLYAAVIVWNLVALIVAASRGA